MQPTPIENIHLRRNRRSTSGTRKLTPSATAPIAVYSTLMACASWISRSAS